MPRKYPKLFICKLCGKEYWKKRSGGYCSIKCSMEARKLKYLEKYGRVSHPSSNNREKAKLTCLEKYGVENPSQIESVKKKKADTFLAHYGKTTYLLTEESKKQYKEISLQKYGVDNPAKSDKIKEKNNTI